MENRRLVLATDAWMPQINGVVRTLQKTIAVLNERNIDVTVVEPSAFRTIACPLYPEIRLAFPAPYRIAKTIDSVRPHYIHIATEGPIGLQVRRYCRKPSVPFTTSFHTRFPEYVEHLAHIPQWMIWPLVRWFHAPARAVMTPSNSMVETLTEKNFRRVTLWGRGINTELFRPLPRNYPAEHRPILMYVGRVSREKNVEAFLRLTDLPGTKYVVGDGPHRAGLERQYPDVRFLGYKTGFDLAEAYANADVLVFPSLTDTFGNVQLEALATGTPVAAFPAPGPRDVLIDPAYGCCHEDLRTAVLNALEHGNRERAAEYARSFTWDAATDQFQSNLTPILQPESSEPSVIPRAHSVD
ncbi:MAG: glycosyltransferase family 1 protein [Bdellovibrionales bacterium]|nr:glycosyltransferase family 1 protein [Bdellovibrionales bacterium]